MWIAIETFSTNVDGVPVVITRHRDLVEEGHELLARFPQFFQPAKARFAVTPEVEEATAPPGGRPRGRPRKVLIGAEDG